jgi:glycosyltransferase involved in cell wall biosynthesis
MRKVGINTYEFYKWAGGRDILIYIAKNGKFHEKTKLEFIIPKNDINFKISRYSFFVKQLIKNMLAFDFKIPKNNPFDFNQIKDFFSTIDNINCVEYASSKKLYYKQLNSSDYDIVLPFLESPIGDVKFNWIGYITDYQHKYYKKLFQKKELIRRDNYLAQLTDKAKSIIVNAHNVKDDIAKFHPNSNASIHILPFIPDLNSNFESQSGFNLKQYGIDLPFFIISNQFWIHKNHITAFKAFKKFLKDYNENFQLVCTGLQQDPRKKDHFELLEKYVEKNNLEKKVLFLGHVSKKDQLNLIFNSEAMIQPTLFEGGPGGGCVVDAMKLNKPIIISDITVNKELPPSDKIIFFNSMSPNDLKNKLIEFDKNKFLFNSHYPRIKDKEERWKTFWNNIYSECDG